MPAIKGDMYINIHCNYSQPTLIKLDNENIGGHLTPLQYHRRSAGSMNGAGILAVAANQDQSGGQFLLLRPVIMRGGLACGHRVSPHGRTALSCAVN